MERRVPVRWAARQGAGLAGSHVTRVNVLNILYASFSSFLPHLSPEYRLLET